MKRCLLLFAALSATIVLAGCYVPSPKVSKTVTDDRSGQPGDADSVTVNLSLGVGRLTVTGGARGLYDAEFRYNIPDWKPDVSYEVSKHHGALSIEQPSGVVGATWPGNVRYEWDIKLSDRLPAELSVDLGAGKTDLDLRGVPVYQLKVDAGVGEGTIDLSGDRKSDLDAHIEAGVGRLTVILPRELGVRAEVSGGIGEVQADDMKRQDDVYLNDSWDRPGAKIRLYIEGGVGHVELKLAPAGGAI